MKFMTGLDSNISKMKNVGLLAKWCSDRVVTHGRDVSKLLIGAKHIVTQYIYNVLHSVTLHLAYQGT